jgi:prepilin-type N-terminal cleavage/methylation domain-containing protein
MTTVVQRSKVLADSKRPRGRSFLAFTIVELLVVIAIIAVLATIGLPAISRGFGKGTAISGAQRQLLDDLALARLQAINSRTTVYVVFAPTNIWDRINGETDPKALRVLTNLVSAPYTGYAILAKRTVGDQPGRDNPRYLTEWKRLPERILIPDFKFARNRQIVTNEYFVGFEYKDGAELPFPRSRYFRPGFLLPYIAFDPQGQLTSGRDELIPLAQGSVFFEKDSNDRYKANAKPDVIVKPPNNYTNNFIRISWLTGRASVDEATRPKFVN